MHKTFIEYGASYPVAEHTHTAGMEITLQYYLDGYEVTLNPSYEGGPRFDIEPGVQRDVVKFLQDFVAGGHVYVGYQVMRVRAFSNRTNSPRSRYDHVVEAPNTDIGEDLKDVIYKDERSQEQEQGEHVRGVDPQLAGEQVPDQSGQPGSDVPEGGRRSL